MDGVPDFDTIDVELDEFSKTKQKARCRDEFLNSICDDNEEIYVNFEGIEDDFVAPEPRVVISGDEDSDHEHFEYPIHDPKVKWNRMRPMLYERYESPQQLKACLVNYSIAQGYQIRFKKSDSVRVIAICASDPEKFRCPFLVKASWMSTERSFQIKWLIDTHTCVRNFGNARHLDPSWLATQFVKDLISKPSLKCKEMQTIVQSKFHCKVSWTTCYRARCRAMSLIEGKLSDHYAKVWDYAQELMRSNPGSTIKVSVIVNTDQTTTFHRFYTCFKAINDGWKRGCRRVIGLDGSFLKGRCKGELLTTIGRDANNQIYPIAWAVVDIENKANWKWFLELIEGDLDLDDGRGMCVISDQHKGLLEATKEILPHVEHRQCARHIYANFRKVYSGIEFRNMFWAASKSTTEGEFNMHMQSIKEISPDAYDHLMARNPTSWCRAFFPRGLTCEAVENGIDECFNAIIVEPRKKPLLTMLEEIRLYMIDMIFN